MTSWRWAAFALDPLSGELNIDGTSGAEMAFFVKGDIAFAVTDFVGLV